MNRQNTLCVRLIALVVLTLGAWALTTCANAGELPVATGSPLAGIAFDDRPLQLPVQRDFQMAMLTAGSELGRSCGALEAYGWRLSQTEQDRVDQVFNNTVDKLRAQGFAVESKTPISISRDITMFTADRSDRHLLFMWSAGEIGLVTVLCETSAPIGGTHQAQTASNAPVSRHVLPQSGMAPSLQSAQHPTSAVLALHKALASSAPSVEVPKKRDMYTSYASQMARPALLSPVGDWVGSYSCAQGVTGGTLSITQVKGERFEGVFKFYPTERNPSVPKGSYTVYGDYDAESQRILINPGKWLQRPKNYYNTILIGSFNASMRTFSGYFQGITGCTSFEAHYKTSSASATKAKLETKHAMKKKAVKSKAKVKVKVKVKTKSIVMKELAPSDKAKTEVKPVDAAPLVNSATPASTATPPLPIGINVQTPSLK